MKMPSWSDFDHPLVYMFLTSLAIIPMLYAWGYLIGKFNVPIPALKIGGNQNA